MATESNEVDQSASEEAPKRVRSPGEPLRWGRKLVTIALIPGCWFLMQEAGKRPDLVEEWYSTFAYPWIAAALTKISGSFPDFSIGEVLLGLLVLWFGFKFLVGTARVLRGSRGLFEALMRGILDTASTAGVLALCFTLLWGLNYHREPFAKAAELEPFVNEEASAQELEELCDHLVVHALQFRKEVGIEIEGGKPKPIQLSGTLDDVIRRSDKGYSELPMRYKTLAGDYSPAKQIYSSEFFAHLSLWGIYSPFTGEANINSTIPDCALPFIICHEMAHQRGYAREDEANFIAYLACRYHRDADFRYCGYLMSLRYALNALERADANRYNAFLGDVSEDEAMIDASVARKRGRIPAAIWADFDALGEWFDHWTIGEVHEKTQAVNDAYLQANGQADGTRSYDRMVTLLLADLRMQKAER